MRIDLHTHSRASDGTDTPHQLVAAAAQAGLDVVAVTDHDTTAGWADTQLAAREFGVGVVRGIEISTTDYGRSVHVLAYLPTDPPAELRDAMTVTRTSRTERAHRLTELVGREYDITWHDVLAQAHGDTIGRPHIADALVAKRLVPHRDAAFAGVLRRAGSTDRGYTSPATTTVVNLIRASGGVAVLAHPMAGPTRSVLHDDDIERFVAAGVGGLEVDHPEHDDRARRRLRAMAAHYGLIMTGSSDYHGEGKTQRLGDEITDPAEFERLVAAGDLIVGSS